jgi:hypothetical protein
MTRIIDFYDEKSLTLEQFYGEEMQTGVAQKVHGLWAGMQPSECSLFVSRAYLPLFEGFFVRLYT